MKDKTKLLTTLRFSGVLDAELKQAVMEAAAYAGIKPNDMVRFIVDYKNGEDSVEPCAAVMTFCKRFAALLRAANFQVQRPAESGSDAT